MYIILWIRLIYFVKQKENNKILTINNKSQIENIGKNLIKWKKRKYNGG